MIGIYCRHRARLEGPTLAEQLERYRWLIVAIFSIPLVAGVVFLVERRLDDPDPPIVRSSSEPIADIRVYVTGAVQNPGVYPLTEDSRWVDAIEAAGGFAPDANPEAVNLARRVQDEDHIVVPRAGQPVAAGVSQGPLDINSASESDLISLPGIGEERARRIVASRAQDGPFSTPEDLLARELVPESVFEDIAAFITVSP